MMSRLVRCIYTVCLLLLPTVQGREVTLTNDRVQARIDDGRLVSLRITGRTKPFLFTRDDFLIELNGKSYKAADVGQPKVTATPTQVTSRYRSETFQVDVIYELQPSWDFVSKHILIEGREPKDFSVGRLEVLRTELTEAPSQVHIHRTKFSNLETRDYGAFMRFGDGVGLLALVQNPFNEISHDGHFMSIGYKADMGWKPQFGAFASDRALLAPYQTAGDPVNIEMTPEWKLESDGQSTLDRVEIDAFTRAVRAFLVGPPAKPLRIFVGWCVNDYQVDVSTTEGRNEYKRIIDRAAELGAEHVLYAPTNSALSRRDDSTDDWSWENLLWLGLGQKIRRGEWKSANDTIPPTVQEMLDYAKSRGVKLVAYVYPVLPFSGNDEWIVRGSKHHRRKLNASLGVRSFQDWLIKELKDFQRRTGISGYSFDYTFLWYEGTSRYAQWHGWRRVMETLRRDVPDVVIDGRQLYMQYGPWSWLAGSYPHPSGTDEQPESFVPFPDLHFDRVSANRQRYTAYWYRNYEFCPTELLPGFITHQTPRNDETGNMPMRVVTRGDWKDSVPLPFRRRDWDYLGWRYSLLSSIATAGWNHVINMIPARDVSEYQAFSKGDKEFFKKWLDWADTNREILRHTRTIGREPGIGRIDGTAAITGDRGFVFLFNPNGRKLNAEFTLNRTIGLETNGVYSIRELYPRTGMLHGKPGKGVWNYGDGFSTFVPGTSAMVLEIIPIAAEIGDPLLFGAPGSVRLDGTTLRLSGVQGEIGTAAELAVAVPPAARVQTVTANATPVAFTRRGDLLSIPVRFSGEPFTRSEQVGSYDPQFSGGAFRGSFRVPERIMAQLRERAQQWPIPWTSEDLRTTWLAPERLLLFIQIAEPDDSMPVTLKLNGETIPLQKAYASIRTHGRSFVGFYADVSNLSAGRTYGLELNLPALKPGQFQGVFFDNVESESTGEIEIAPSR